MKKAIIIVALIFSGLGSQQVIAQTEDGPSIGGVIWATKNVGAATPQDYGNYYTWEEATKVCPQGWRLPTMAEFAAVVETERQLLGRGAWFADQQLYFPYAGYYYETGQAESIGSVGSYWSGDQNERRTAAHAYGVWSSGFSADHNLKDKKDKRSVRCVKVNNSLPDYTYLDYYHAVDGVPRYSSYNYSKLSGQFGQMENGKYAVALPFIVSPPVPDGEIFWLALKVPSGSSVETCGIYTWNKDNELLSKTFKSFQVGDDTYFIQSLNIMMSGHYVVRVQFSEAAPDRNDLEISIAYSPKAAFESYVARLDSSAASNELVGTKWSYSYSDPYFYFSEEFGLEFLGNGQVRIFKGISTLVGADSSSFTGTYTFDGKTGTIKPDDKSFSFTKNSNGTLTVKKYIDGEDTVFKKVSSFDTIEE